MLTIKLRKLLVMTIATVLAVAGLIVSNRPAQSADTPPRDHQVSAEFYGLESGIAGEDYVYDVRISNAGQEERNIALSVELPQGSWDLRFADPLDSSVDTGRETLCQAYRYSVSDVGGGDEISGDKFKCFKERLRLERVSLEGERHPTVVGGVVNVLPQLMTYSFKIKLKLPYFLPSNDLKIKIKPENAQEKEIIQPQAVDNKGGYKGEVSVMYGFDAPSNSFRAGDPNHIDANDSYVALTGTWENIGDIRIPRLGFTLSSSLRRYSGSSASGDHSVVNGLKFLYTVECDVDNSSPDVCEKNSSAFPSTERDVSHPPAFSSFVNLDPGEKIAVRMRVRMYAGCGVDSPGQVWKIRGNIYTGQAAFGNMQLTAPQQENFDIVQVDGVNACPEVPIDVEWTGPHEIHAGEKVKYQVTYTNRSENIVADKMGIRLGFSSLEPNRYRIISVPGGVQATCSADEGVECPWENATYEIGDPQSNADSDLLLGNFRKSQGLYQKITLPPGKKITFTYEYVVTLDADKCLPVAGKQKGDPVPASIFYRIDSTGGFTSGGTRIVYNYVGDYQRLDGNRAVKQFTLHGGKACGPGKARMQVIIDQKEKKRSWNKGQEYIVTIRNEGSITWKDSFSLTYYSGHVGGRGVAPFGWRQHYEGIASYNTGIKSSSNESVLNIGEFKLEPGEEKSWPLLISWERFSDIQGGICPPAAAVGPRPGGYGSRPIKPLGVPGRYLEHLGKSDFHYALNNVLAEFPDYVYRNGFDLGKQVAEVSCSDIVSYVKNKTSEGGRIPPKGPMWLEARISSQTGSATNVPYEIRFPEGSIIFPEAAFRKENLLDPVEQLPNPVVTCSPENGGSCEGVTARLDILESQGNRFLRIRGTIPALRDTQGILMRVNGLMGVVGKTGGDAYVVDVLTAPQGALNTVSTPNSATMAELGGPYAISNTSWQLGNELVDFAWKNLIVDTIGTPATLPSGPRYQFEGRADCESGAAISGMSAVLTPQASQTLSDPAVRLWYKDTCDVSVRSPRINSGQYVWKTQLPGQATPIYSLTATQKKRYSVESKGKQTLTFEWVLVSKPRVVTATLPSVKDPCGANNARYVQPENTDTIHWRTNLDRSVDAIAQDGYAFEGSSSGEWVTVKHFDAPADSGALCPTIAVKVAGARAEGSDHQFTVAWKQNTPAATPGATAVTTTTAPGHNTVAATSQAVDTTHGAMGTLSVTTTPVEAFRFYDPTMACYYERPATGAGAGGATTTKVPIDVIENPSATTSKSWDLNIPTEVGAFPITCETAVAAAFSTVTLNPLDGGYTGTAPEGQAAASIGAAMEWSIYPETTPGSFDTSHGTGATFDTNSGVYSFEGLGAGTYYIGLTQAPTGYEADTLGVVGAAGVEKVAANNKDYIKVTVSAGRPMQVTVYGKRQLGSLTFDKISAVDGSLLEGSAWMLTSTEGGNGDGDWAQGVPLTDCVANEAAACTGLDKQPEAGKFHIDALKWGNYELRETQAPVGFRLPENGANGKDFTVQADALTHSFTGGDAITNDHSGVPNIPHTGGLGRDHLLISGMLVLLIAGVATVLLLRTAQQRP